VNSSIFFRPWNQVSDNRFTYRPLLNLHFPIFMNLILYTSFPFPF
jgi:hypothetical protein